MIFFKNKYGKSLIAIGIFLLSIQVYGQSQVDTILTKLNNPSLQEVLVVAHRGDWRNFPENSISAIESAVKMGVDIVEIDVQRTKDGHLILLHDATLDRTTTGKGRVDESTLESIKKLKLRNGCAIRTKHDVPTLEEALLVAKGKVLLNLDKADRFFDQVYILLEQTGTTKQIIMKGGKSPEEVKNQFGAYLNDVIYMPIVNLDHPKALDDIKMFVGEMNPIAFELVYKNKDNPLPLQVKELLENKSLIWYNTLWDTLAGGYDDDLALEDPELSYGYLIKSLGARIIQTDRPQMLIDYLKNQSIKD